MQIREYKDEDYDEISDLIDDEYECGHFQYLIEEETEHAYVAMEGQKAAGVSIAELDGKEAYVFLYVSEQYRNQGIGSLLLKKMEQHLKQLEITCVNLDYVVNEENRAFFHQLGYQVEFTSELMYYHGLVKYTQQHEIRPYQDADYLESRTVDREAFHKMQVSVGIEAEDFVYPPNEAQRKEYLKNRENRYVMIDHGDIVGVLLLDDEEIDTIAVKPEFQRCGYGTELLHYAEEKILKEQGAEQAELWCIVGNTAREFYLKEGFEPERIHDIANKKLM